jgi:hypothetical protein
MKPNILTYLVIGLAKYYELTDAMTMFPDELQYALNHLSLSGKSAMPKTFHGFLQQCQMPLHTWWPSQLTEIDMNMPLVEDDGLSFMAENYLLALNQNNIHLGQSISQISSLLDNNNFRILYQQLKNVYSENPVQAQVEYVLLRRFLIENPFTSLVSLMQVFRDTKFIQRGQVRELYHSTAEQPDLKRNQSENYYHTCPRCGPIYVKHGTLRSIKPSVCTSQCPQNRDGWQTINPENQLVLRRTHQKRILIPGIPELRLFADLMTLHETYPELLQVPQLWPYLDTYDIELHFSDAIWVVDVKDHKDPYRLGKTDSGNATYRRLVGSGFLCLSR